MRAMQPELAGFFAALSEASAISAAPEEKAPAAVPDRTREIRRARNSPVDLKSQQIASTPVDEADQFDFSTFVRKLNTLRAGRSLKKHPDLRVKLDSYFTNLDEGERTAIVTFLDAIGKIITADTAPASVPDPSDPPANVKMTRSKAEELVREVVKQHIERKRAAGRDTLVRS